MTVTTAAFQAAIDGKVKVCLQFSGQGIGFFEELLAIYQRSVATRPLISKIAKDLAELAKDKSLSKLFAQGLDVQQWLDNPKSKPDASYLATTPVSYPLSGLTQMATYYAVMKENNVPLESFLGGVSGAVGHSSGVCAAVCAAISHNIEDLEANIHGMVLYLFWHGVRCTQCFLGGSDVPELKEGTPTPMLVISQMPWKKLERILERIVKKHDSLSIGLCNGPSRYVAVGTVAGIKALQEALKSHEETTGDEIAVEYMQTTCPYHSDLLLPAVDDIMQDVKNAPASSPLSRLQSMPPMKFPVYSTLDGSDMRQANSILESMCRMQSVQPLDWQKAVAPFDADKSPTFMFDFGPGGARSAVALTTKLLKENEELYFFCASRFTANQPYETSKVVHSKVLYEYGTGMVVAQLPPMRELAMACRFKWTEDSPMKMPEIVKAMGCSALPPQPVPFVDGAFQSIPDAKRKGTFEVGKEVKIITDTDNILKWCRLREIDEEFDSKRQQMAGKMATIQEIDTSDNTIKVKAGLTEVWIPVQAACAA